MTAADEKSRERNRAKLRLTGVTPEDVAKRSAAACGHLLDRWAEPGPVMAYLALPQEADPAGAMAVWRARGATVCVPRIDWAGRAMEPAVLGDRVVAGPKGIRQAESAQPTIDAGALRLAIVPGLSFTRDGRRLGRGAGFYDRFLARLDGRAVTVGLALEAQIVDDLPTEPHDRTVDWLVTEDGAAACRPAQHDPEGV